MIQRKKGKPARCAGLAAIAALLSINSVANAAGSAASQEPDASDTAVRVQTASVQPTLESSAPSGEPIMVAQYAPSQPAPVIAAATPEANPYARFSQYMVKGWNVTMPDPSNYIDQDPFGYRTAMEADGFFFFGFSNNTFTYDLRNDNQLYGSPQLYSGQKPTIVTSNYAFLTYDLGKAGLQGGQLTAGVTYNYVNWEPAGPTHWHISDLKYFQTLFDGKAELTIGYLGNSIVYNGIYIGGNLAGGTFGVNANIPQETGQSTSLITRPGVNFKVYLGDGFYNLAGVQRSWNPGGAAAEIKANGFGFGTVGPHVGELFLEEFGYKCAAEAGEPFTWVRAGYGFNNSDYASLKTHGTTANNHYLSLLGDRQLLQLSDAPTAAYRGLYAGFTVMDSPAEVDRFAQYYEFRVYMKGPFANRPFDSMSLVVNQNRFSKYAVASSEARGLLTDDQATTTSLGYTANVLPGVFLTSGLSYVNHPRTVTTIAEQRSALNFLTNVIIYY
jgi:porin